MTTFLRLTDAQEKEDVLLATVKHGGERLFEAAPESFRLVPGAPFAYWASDAVREMFKRFSVFEGDGRTTRVGLQTSDDSRFLRLWWEVPKPESRWRGLAKGGRFARFYSDVSVLVNWEVAGVEIASYPSSVIRNPDFYGRPGLTWPLRGTRFSAQAVPIECIFSVAGKMAFAPMTELEVWLAIFNSRPFDYLVNLFAGKVGGVQYEVGLIGGIPIPEIGGPEAAKLRMLARRGWILTRSTDATRETSHSFLLPPPLRACVGGVSPDAAKLELVGLQAELDEVAFTLYGFSPADRRTALRGPALDSGVEAETDEADEDEPEEANHSFADALLSWGVGVAFGRFDWRLATGESEMPPEPGPFDPLPAKSPGMLPDGAEPFHKYAGVLVDDPGHPHHLARLVEMVLERVDFPVDVDARRWLQRDFFSFHLKQYSKSRRKAPIYWPLSTASGGYTLWLYYPSLSNQTLFTTVNDFVEPKLGLVRGDAAALRQNGTGRSRAEESQLEALESLEAELVEFRDTLLNIAQHYEPHHDDGVQITAAPLWPLFRHKPWQKELQKTWAKLEKGEYDWAHLAMNYWPERVRAKCKTDKSLAIAHGLENLYVESRSPVKKSRATPRGDR